VSYNQIERDAIPNHLKKYCATIDIGYDKGDANNFVSNFALKVVYTGTKIFFLDDRCVWNNDECIKIDNHQAQDLHFDIKHIRIVNAYKIPT